MLEGVLKVQVEYYSSFLWATKEADMWVNIVYTYEDVGFLFCGPKLAFRRQIYRQRGKASSCPDSMPNYPFAYLFWDLIYFSILTFVRILSSLYMHTYISRSG